MEKRIKAYLVYLSKIDYENLDEQTKSKVKEEMLTQIAFFQHERLIHLIVTFAFAIMAFFGLLLIATAPGAGPFLLEAMLIVLLIPYIRHYYILENSVQKMYGYFDRLNGKIL